MQTIEEHVDIALPVTDAYAQWTQFEAMPGFLRHVDAAQQIDDRRVMMQLGDAGDLAMVAAEITEQIPDRRIAWRSRSGPRCSGCLTFHRIDDRHSRVMVQIGLEVADEGADGRAVVDRVRHALLGDLDDFRCFLEGRGEPTGRWGGSVAAPGERGAEDV